MPLNLHFEVKQSSKKALWMRQWIQNIEQITNNPTIVIYFGDFCNCLYISTTELYVCNYSSHFYLFHCVRVNYPWKKWVGNNIYLFLKINFLLLVNLLKNKFYTYRYHQSIIKKTFDLLKLSSFLVMQLKVTNLISYIRGVRESNQEISLFLDVEYCSNFTLIHLTKWC